MKAVICKKYGPPNGLELIEIEKPIPKDNEVLVKVHATTVTSGDTVLRKMTIPKYLLMAPFARLFYGVRNLRKKILGHEFAGEIVAVGKGVKLFRKGDPVFGTTGFAGGAHSEYLCLPEKGVITTMPENLNYKEAAAIPIGALSALSFLRKGNIQKDKQVVIYGASGSIGTFAVQLAKYFRANVTGVCSTKNLELIKSLGADKVIDYTQDDFTKGEQSYDLIFDAVGKAASFSAKKVLKKKGYYISTNSSPVKESTEDLIFLKKLCESEIIKPVIDTIYPLEKIAEAHHFVDKGHKKGNIVLTLDTNLS